jgi:DNA polymerase-3 subunit delta'
VPFRDIIRHRAPGAPGAPSGHRRIVELLSRSVARDTLPPSLIFAGPSGAATRATAIALAQALNCANPVSDSNGQAAPGAPDTRDACGECPSCLRIARGVHPDILLVEPGENGTIRIEQVRELVDRAAYRPFEGRRRVVIVDDADLLVPAAQNALLKTLEEPPSSSVFILVTSRPDMLLATVRSRCVRLTFAASAEPEVDVDARQIAERVLHQAASGPDTKRLEGAKDLLTGTGAGGAADREQVAAHLQAMASLLRDIAAIGARAGDAALVNREAKPSLDRLAPAYPGDRAVKAFDAVDRALEAIERNAGVKVVADWLVLQL